MNFWQKKKYRVILLILVFVVFLFGISYALFSTVLYGKKEYTVRSGNLQVLLDESKTGSDIVLENALPVSDEDGMKNSDYHFSLVNEENQDLAYTIYLKEKELANKTPSSTIRYHYTRDIDDVKVTRNIVDQKTDEGRYYLETGVIPAKNTYQYTFKMWIDYRAGNEILNTEYSISLEVEAAQTISIYQEDVLNGTDPVLSENLVPVIIEDDGTVKKASLYKEWYQYEKQEWANAVVLEDKKVEYNVGDTIPESNIQSYFVWIPRYKYKIFDEGNYSSLAGSASNNVKTIEVEFESKNTEISNGSTKDSWLSHPAFQAFDSNGFWVGKFESGYKGATTTEEAQQNISDYSKLIIKPNVYSWRNITVGNAFDTSYNYLRDEESHMMKNTEWGAVAYLQHSKYGSRASVRINNNSSYLTGYAAVSESTCGPTTNNASSDCNKVGSVSEVTLPYNTPTGYTATTTANISGIYDMSGGAWEYVMGYNTKASSIGESSGLTSIYGDFFSSTEWDKYYDSYSNTTETVYTGRILGDATGEMGPFFNVTAPNGTAYHNSSWYNDYGNFLISADPWFIRGGRWTYGSMAGVFTFNYYTGAVSTYYSFRIVLNPKGGM